MNHILLLNTFTIYNKHLNNFPINFTIKELIFSSIQDKYKINIFNNRTAILRNEKGRSIRILYYTKREKKKKRKKRNKRHKYSEFQHADRSFDLVANKFLPPFSDSPSLCKGKPRPFSPSFPFLVFQQLSALHSFKREFFSLSAKVSRPALMKGAPVFVVLSSTLFLTRPSFTKRAESSRAHQTECGGIPSR